MQLFKEVHNYLLILVSLNIQILSHWNENWIQNKLHISYCMLSRTFHGSHYLWSDSSQLILFSLFPLQVTKIDNMLMLYSAVYFCFATLLFKVWCLESYSDIYYSTFIGTCPVFIHCLNEKECILTKPCYTIHLEIFSTGRCMSSSSIALRFTCSNFFLNLMFTFFIFAWCWWCYTRFIPEMCGEDERESFQPSFLPKELLLIESWTNRMRQSCRVSFKNKQIWSSTKLNVTQQKCSHTHT